MGRTSPSLGRRIDALEEYLHKANEAHREMVRGIIWRLSQASRESLIDAGVARLKGRNLTECEAAAEQAYSAIVESEYRWRASTVRGMPRLDELISQVNLMNLSERDLLLYMNRLRALINGYTPNEAELAATRVLAVGEEAQYQRAGFKSKAEFEQWFETKAA